MKRVFISIHVEPDPDIMGVYDEFRAGLKNEPVKWVSPENFHITLAFLGSLDDKKIALLSDKFEKVSALWKPFIIEPAGVGVFKNIRTPSVLWFGFKDNAALENLKYQIDEMLHEEGLPVDQGEFRPHLTFARMKKRVYLKELEVLVNKYEQKEFDSITIGSFLFNESTLKPGGPVYKPLGIYRFSPV